MKLRFRPAALADLEDIYDYIAADNPVGASEFIDLIRAKCKFLQKTPHGGRMRREIRDDLRSFPVKTYVTFYRIDGDEGEIVNVIRGNRDIRPLAKIDFMGSDRGCQRRLSRLIPPDSLSPTSLWACL